MREWKSRTRTYPRMEIRVLLLLLPFLFPDVAWAAFGKAPKVRVRVAHRLKNVLISGIDLQRKNLIDKKTKLFKGNKSIRYNCHRLGFSARLDKSPVLLASLAGADNLIAHEQSVYKGDLHIITSTKQDSCDVILEIDIDLYISQLLSKEMNKEWPLEALKAQAIAARTYAYHKMASKQVNRQKGFETHYDLESSEKHQVGGDYSERNSRTDRAAIETKGYILTTKKGNLTAIFFHAKCGGKTIRPDLAWKYKVEGYQGVKCPYCETHGMRPWQAKISVSRLNDFLNWSGEKKHIIGMSNNSHDKSKDLPMIAPDRESHSLLRMYRDGRAYLVAKSLLRKYFGRFKISSNNFLIHKTSKAEYTIYGKGLGHGVGMCQLGALDMAQRGWGFKKILAHYFPGHKLKKIY